MMKFKDKEFKAIPGYIGYYVSEDAEIYSDASSKLLTLQNELGCFKYPVACLWINGKQKNVPVHKLVALAWCELPEGFTAKDVLGNYLSKNLVVDHIDGNKHNNIASNLRWCTQFENVNFENYNHSKKGALGNKNACGRKNAKSKPYRYIYMLDGKTYTLKELTKELKCSNSKITESFRRNMGLVRQGRLTRKVFTKEA